MNTQPTILLGPPGTGKTTRLLSMVDDALKSGVKPERIGFISFTRKAADEARDRAAARFGFSNKKMPYFRTIHSLAFQGLGLSHTDVMQYQHYKDLGVILGVKLIIRSSSRLPDQMDIGEKAIFLDGMARVMRRPLRSVWEEMGQDMDIEWNAVDYISRGLKKFKESRDLIDFTDMLTRYHTEGSTPNLDLLLVDEAQDLSRIQWDIVDRMTKTADKVVYAGDDDQAIFRWSGADVEQFLDLPGQVEVLGQSYRLPPEVQVFSQRMTAMIKHRRPKEFRPATHQGSVNFCSYEDDLPLESGEWLVLTRNNYHLTELKEYCRTSGLYYGVIGEEDKDLGSIVDSARAWERMQKGGTCTQAEARTMADFLGNDIIDTKQRKILKALDPSSEPMTLDMIGMSANERPWFMAFGKVSTEDREYIRAMRRRGENLNQQPRIRLSTIHGAKGGEAENVAMFTDVSYRTFQGMNRNMDDEARVFYVGATRAKRNLYLMNPKTSYYFQT